MALSERLGRVEVQRPRLRGRRGPALPDRRSARRTSREESSGIAQGVAARSPPTSYAEPVDVVQQVPHVVGRQRGPARVAVRQRRRTTPGPAVLTDLRHDTRTHKRVFVLAAGTLAVATLSSIMPVPQMVTVASAVLHRVRARAAERRRDPRRHRCRRCRRHRRVEGVRRRDHRAPSASRRSPSSRSCGPRRLSRRSASAPRRTRSGTPSGSCPRAATAGSRPRSTSAW